MYIKRLSIQGFKSYKDQTAIEEFDPGHNVVVGRNGSGKSNFFSAIRFVLSDQYTSMSREERQALLHDSSSSASTTLSAFVEIVFDNSDGRFPVGAGGSSGEGAEVVLRRTIGLKKDEYSIDRRSANKGDVINLLESAGFSRSNPYYIVPQGRITHLTNIKDRERLDLLKEVAGTKVYEQRRTESLKIMDETDAKRTKIDDLLTYIEERLAELDEEKQELKDFYTQDKERRCLEYAIYYRELQDVVALQEELEDRRRGDADSSSTKQRAFLEREDTLRSLKNDLRDAARSIKELGSEKEALLQERRDLARARANLEALVRDDEETGEDKAEERQRLAARLKELEQSITDQEAELEQVQPEWQTRQAELDAERGNLERIKARVGVLLARQGRSTQYSTQAERDAALHDEIASLEAYKIGLEQRRAEREQERQRLDGKLAEVQAALQARNDQLEEGRRFRIDGAQEWEGLKQRKATLTEQKKDLWKEEAKLNAKTSYTREQLTTSQRALAGMMDKGTARGLQAVERITEQLGLTGVYGPLYTLFTVDDTYKTAVEVTAGNSLFHVVVDTDETATKVLDVMNREKSGRVTFVPLNRIKPKEVDFPQTTDAILMIKKLTFDRRYTAAMQQTFGKTLICPTLEIASAYVRSKGLAAITLDGDQVERKGALTGGYHDPKRSRLDAVKDVQRFRQALDADMARLEEVKATIEKVEQQVSDVVAQMQRLEVKSTQAAKARPALLDEITWLRQEEQDVRTAIESVKAFATEAQRELEASETKRSALAQELNTPLAAGLAPAEANELSQLNAQLTTQQQTVVDLAGTVADLVEQRNSLLIDINENLKRERDQTSARLEAIGDGNLASETGTEGARDADARQAELDSVRTQLEEREERIDAIEKEVEELQKREKELNDQYEKTRSAQANDARDIERQEKSLQRYLSKKQSLATRKDDVNRRIRDLGVLPEDAFTKYVKVKTDKSTRMLHKVHEALKRFGNVNKKAVEQYNNFTKQRDQLITRREELEKSAESIQELIEVLDQRKDEAIERTFKQVSRNFSEVFEKLVPVGKGQLVMQRRIAEDRGEDDMDEDEDEEGGEGRTTSGSGLENYIGVSIRCSFNSKQDEGVRISQLSGGQKTLVALALVFAIQKCDPAPFYLLDEPDANLDAQYRTAVASMISELSESAQFITTTFRPEIVAAADKHYGVFYSAQKVSSLKTISKDEAHQFVEASADAGAAR